MRLTLDQIVEETKHMPADVVAKLVDRILAARHEEVDEAEVASEWKKEIGSRIEDIESGKVKGISVEESLARIRRISG